MIMKRPNFQFMRGDCLNQHDLRKASEDVKDVFHIAADPEVRRTQDLTQLVHQNVIATQALLEELRNRKSVEKLVLASTSTVYGNAGIFPTPEDYGPLRPISVYGATKLACEGLISAYAYADGFQAIILRLANIIGSRSSHGVINDFIAKLTADPSRLQVLGDGTQTKSYMHVNDCINAFLAAWAKSSEDVTILNAGSSDCIDVMKVAEIVQREMKTYAKIELAQSTPNGAGWTGDVKKMWLDIERLKALGWQPRKDSAESVTFAAKELLKNARLPQPSK